MSEGSRSGVPWMRPKSRSERLRDRPREERLADPRHVLDQHVALGQQPHADEAHGAFLTYDRACHLGAEIVPEVLAAGASGRVHGGHRTVRRPRRMRDAILGRLMPNAATLDRARLSALLEAEERRFLEAHPRSVALHERASRSLLGGVPMNWMVRWAGHFPLFVEEASGRPVHATSTATSTSISAWAIRAP